MKRPTYTFGNEQDIYDAFRRVDDADGDIERCQRRIAHSLTGRELVAHGANLAWELAVVEIAREPMATPGLTLMMDFIFDECMAAIVTDAAFLADLIEVRNTVRSQARNHD